MLWFTSHYLPNDPFLVNLRIYLPISSKDANNHLLDQPFRTYIQYLPAASIPNLLYLNLVASHSSLCVGLALRAATVCCTPCSNHGDRRIPQYNGRLCVLDTRTSQGFKAKKPTATFSLDTSRTSTNNKLTYN